MMKERKQLTGAVIILLAVVGMIVLATGPSEEPARHDDRKIHGYSIEEMADQEGVSVEDVLAKVARLDAEAQERQQAVSELTYDDCCCDECCDHDHGDGEHYHDEHEHDSQETEPVIEVFRASEEMLDAAGLIPYENRYLSGAEVMSIILDRDYLEGVTSISVMDLDGCECTNAETNDFFRFIDMEGQYFVCLTYSDTQVVGIDFLQE